MRLLVTGAGGQLGKTFVKFCQSKSVEVSAFDRQSLDISDQAAVAEKVQQHNPDFVINAAAYTAVDKAETEQAQAFAVNQTGAENLAKVCAAAGIPLIHVSTDYVFNGTKETPYVEDDPVLPLGVYGVSKWKGEEAVRDNLQQHIILRVSWVFGVYGNNFVKTIQRLAREREELKVVDDQKGCPTSTDSISRVIFSMINQIRSGSFENFGTYHYCDAPVTNWFEFANAIVDETKKYEQLLVKNIKAIPSSEFPTPVVRPLNSQLDCSKLNKIFNIQQYSWQDALQALVKELSES